MALWFMYVSLLLLVAKIEAVSCPWDVLSDEAIMDCYNQKLEKIPTTIPDHITTVDLSNNSLTALEYNTFLSRRSRIQILDLGNNEISYIEEFAFRPLKELKYLLLRSNRIQIFPYNALESNKEIKLLVLSENRIHISQDGPFLVSESLQELELSGCSIHSLSLLAFSELPNLQRVDLRGNVLTTILDFQHPSMVSVEIKIVLDGNQLDCTPEFLKWASDHSCESTLLCQNKESNTSTLKSLKSIRDAQYTSSVRMKSTTGYAVPQSESDTKDKPVGVTKVNKATFVSSGRSSAIKHANKWTIIMFLLSCWLISNRFVHTI